MTAGNEWLTVSDAAKLSGYHPETIRELIRQGRIKARKVSIIWVIDRDSLTDYIRAARAMGQKRGRKVKP